MEKTPQSNRLHVSIFGETNAGKSALFNAILGTQTAIVSSVSGTTTDPVSKSMELLPYGPIVLTDTAGLGDTTQLGPERVAKTKTVLDRTDLGLYVVCVEQYNPEEYWNFKKAMDKRGVPTVLVYTKGDSSSKEELAEAHQVLGEGSSVSVYNHESVNQLKTLLCDKLSAITDLESSLVQGLVPSGGVVLMVVPIDSEAPKGRLILPQVQMIRDCLDHGIRCNVTTLEYLEKAYAESDRVDLVITDSQVFGAVAKLLPPCTPLTSFSILMARQKGNFNVLLQGANAVKDLKDGAKVLISEVCTHNRTHEDIAHVKIPKMMQSFTGKSLQFNFTSGRDFPQDLTSYDIVVHCGGCMATKREITNRIMHATDQHVPITNYGVVLALCSGILERSIEVLKNLD